MKRNMPMIMKEEIRTCLNFHPSEISGKEGLTGGTDKYVILELDQENYVVFFDDIISRKEKGSYGEQFQLRTAYKIHAHERELDVGIGVSIRIEEEMDDLVALICGISKKYYRNPHPNKGGTKILDPSYDAKTKFLEVKEAFEPTVLITK